MREAVAYTHTVRRLGRWRWGGRVEVLFTPDPLAPFHAPPWRLNPNSNVFGPSIAGCEFTAYTERGLRRMMSRAVQRDHKERTERAAFACS